MIGQDIREYSCDVQDKVYSQQSSLTEHQIIYRGDRPHACDMYSLVEHVCNHKSQASTIMKYQLVIVRLICEE